MKNKYKKKNYKNSIHLSILINFPYVQCLLNVSLLLTYLHTYRIANGVSANTNDVSAFSIVERSI